MRAKWNRFRNHYKDVYWEDLFKSCVTVNVQINFLSGLRLKLLYIFRIEGIRLSLARLFRPA